MSDNLEITTAYPNIGKAEEGSDFLGATDSKIPPYIHIRVNPGIGSISVEGSIPILPCVFKRLCVIALEITRLLAVCSSPCCDAESLVSEPW